MKILGENQEKAEIAYPCEWIYKVIGEDCNLIRDAVVEVCGASSPQIHHSQSSSKGKYHSLEVRVVVESEKMRLSFYESLKKSPAVTVVL